MLSAPPAWKTSRALVLLGTEEGDRRLLQWFMAVADVIVEVLLARCLVAVPAGSRTELDLQAVEATAVTGRRSLDARTMGLTMCSPRAQWTEQKRWWASR